MKMAHVVYFNCSMADSEWTQKSRCFGGVVRPTSFSINGWMQLTDVLFLAVASCSVNTHTHKHTPENNKRVTHTTNRCDSQPELEWLVACTISRGNPRPVGSAGQLKMQALRVYIHSTVTVNGHTDSWLLRRVKCPMLYSTSNAEE